MTFDDWLKKAGSDGPEKTYMELDTMLKRNAKGSYLSKSDVEAATHAHGILAQLLAKNYLKEHGFME